MKTYTPASKHVADLVAGLLRKYYQRLHKEKVRIDLLFVSTDGEGAALKHQGYAAQAVVRVLGVKDRAAGRGDAEIVIDEMNFGKLTEKQQLALLDHELYHLTLKTNAAGVVKRDGAERPVLGIRKHDRQVGWFDSIAQRHGDDSLEVIQARALIQEAGQFYFPFMRATTAAEAA